jgi:hypothetical protein
MTIKIKKSHRRKGLGKPKENTQRLETNTFLGRVCVEEKKNKVKERGKRTTMMTTKTKRITYHFDLLHSVSDMC